MELRIPLNATVLTEEEQLQINGGAPWGKIIMVLAAAVVAVYEAGKAVGETAYWITH